MASSYLVSGRTLDASLIEVLTRLGEIERELLEIKLRLGGVLSVDQRGVEGAVEGFLALGEEVSRRWVGAPSVLGEFRKSRGHACADLGRNL